MIGAAIVDGAVSDAKLATVTTAGKVLNSATPASSANTANAILTRDASGNFAAGNISAASVNTTGNVGIGTTTPAYPLQVYRALNSSISVDTASGSSTNLLLNSDTYSSIKSASSFGIHIGGTEQIRISPSDNVGIGTTTPSTTLAVNGSLSVKVMTVNATRPIPSDVAVVIVTASVNLTLPSCSAANSGQLLTLVSRGSNTGMISAPTGTYIFPSGAPSPSASASLSSSSPLRLVCDGTSNWQSI